MVINAEAVVMVCEPFGRTLWSLKRYFHSAWHQLHRLSWLTVSLTEHKPVREACVFIAP